MNINSKKTASRLMLKHARTASKQFFFHAHILIRNNIFIHWSANSRRSIKTQHFDSFNEMKWGWEMDGLEWKSVWHGLFCGRWFFCLRLFARINFFLYLISSCGAKSNRIDIFVRSYESINMINMSEEKDHLYGKKVNNGKTKLCTNVWKTEIVEMSYIICVTSSICVRRVIRFIENI